MRMKSYPVIFISFLLACNHSGYKFDRGIDTANFNPDTSEYAILKLDTSKNDLFGKNVDPAGLSKADIIEAEQLMDSTVDEYNKDENNKLNNTSPQAPASSGYDPRIKDLSKYKRQLIAAVDSNYEKLVWINCFYDFEPHEEWRKYPIGMSQGGGNWFFNLKINLTTRKVYDFMVNGPL